MRSPSTLLLAGLAAMMTSTAVLAQSAPKASTDTSVVKEYRGAYQRGFEQSWFVPCRLERGETRWWVTLTDEALTQRDSILAARDIKPGTALEIRVSASVGPRMEAGMMGGGSRYMLVTKFLDIRPLPAGGTCSSFNSA